MVFGRLFGGGDIVEKVKLQGDSTDLEGAAKRAETSLTGSMIKSQLAVQALNKAFAIGKKVIGDVVSAGLEYERTVVRQTAALSKYGEAASGLQTILMQEASVLQELTAISDEEIRNVQTLAINYGVAAQDVDKYVRAAVKMSNVTGKDLKNSLEQLIKTEQGLIDRTLKVIPGISDLTKKQLKSGEAIDLVNEKWNEFIDVQAEGAIGSLNNLERAYEDLAEAISLAIGKQGTFANAVVDELTATLSDVSVITGEAGLAAGADAASGFLRGWLENSPFRYLPFVDQYMKLFMPTAEGVAKLADQYRQAAENAATLARRRLELGLDKPPKGASTTDAPKGAPGSRAGEGRGKSPYDFSGTEGVGGFVEIAGVAFTEAEAAEIESRKAKNEILLQWEEDFGDGLAMIKDSNNEVLAIKEEAALAESQERWQAYHSNIQQGLSIAGNATMAFFDDLMAGEEMAIENLGVNLLKGIGRMVFQKGTADMAVALANAVIWKDPTGIAPAGAEIAVGGAMMAGGSALGKHVSETRAENKAQESLAGAGGGGSFAGGGYGGRRQTYGQGRGTQNITINVQGAVTAAEVGVQISRSLNEAKRQGLI